MDFFGAACPQVGAVKARVYHQGQAAATVFARPPAHGVPVRQNAES
jgi:hypothetical protein